MMVRRPATRSSSITPPPLLLLLLLFAHTCGQSLESSRQWWDLARTELAAALNVRDNWNVAKNVILFLGDGMGITASTAARIYKGQKKGMHGEEGYLEWERFPNCALIKTYNVDRQVPDSAATATAFLCGVKVNYETIGVDPLVSFGDCEASKNPQSHLTSILQWAQEANKSTGLVTSTRITHATPAASYSHVANRRWECDSQPGEEGHGCPDIAQQLVTHSPGKNIKVVLGGGRQALGATLGIPDESSCQRTDNRDLTREWLDAKLAAGHRARYITSANELRSINHDHVDYLMGLFADGHIPYVSDQAASSSNSPSLAEMATAAVKQLSKDDNGFFLMVEGGRIDHAYHNNQPQKALEETLAFDSAVASVLKDIDLDETLVIVTADHSHVLTINGYPKRGNDILGLADVSDVDGLPFTTLMFTNGPGFNITTTDGGHNVTRGDPSEYPLSNPEHKSQTAVPMKAFKETHGGEDVALYAAGPMSHLFHRLHEQHYVAHVMAYAACIGPSAGLSCRRPSHASNLDDEELFSLPHSPLRKSEDAFLSSNLKASTSVDFAAEAAKVASSAGIFVDSASPSTSNLPVSSSSERTSSFSSFKAINFPVIHATDIRSAVEVGTVVRKSPRPSKLPAEKKREEEEEEEEEENEEETRSASTSIKFPTLSPTLQHQLDISQQRIINALGLESIKDRNSFSLVRKAGGVFDKPANQSESHML